MAGIILLTFTACQSDELANGGRNGEVAASFSVQLPGNGNDAVTRAVTAGDGNLTLGSSRRVVRAFVLIGRKGI